MGSARACSGSSNQTTRRATDSSSEFSGKSFIRHLALRSQPGSHRLQIRQLIQIDRPHRPGKRLSYGIGKVAEAGLVKVAERFQGELGIESLPVNDAG